MIPPSLADIATSTGFAVSTVSRALRDSPEIPLATRKKIKDAARTLNYRPNPILASLAQKHFGSRSNDGIPLAYFHLPVGPEDESLVRSIVKANRDHARKLGYRLDPFLVTDFKDGTQATRVLFSRGFQGIILPPRFRFEMLPGMDWDRFAVAGSGEIITDSSTPHSISVNYAAMDHFRAVLTAWDETRKRGYQRIGFAFFRISSAFMEDQIRWGAAQACLRRVPPRCRIPPFVQSSELDMMAPSDFAKWVRLHRLDAVIGFNNYMRWALEHEGFRVPEDIAFASLHRETSSNLLGVKDDRASGMKDLRLEVAFAAIELLDQQIRHHQYGLLPVPRIQMIQSKWIDGDSLPDRKTARFAARS